MTDAMRERMAKAIYDEMEGPVNNQDLKRQIQQHELSLRLAQAIIAALPDMIPPLADPCKPLEDAVLMALPGRNLHPVFHDDYYHYLNSIAEDAGVDKEAARFACKRLRDKGLAVYRSGLFNEDGEVAGSGYALTDAGREAALGIAQEGV